MPRKSIIVFALSLLNVGLRAAFTNEVDVISLGRSETELLDLGWRVTSVTNYGESYRNALRFNVKGSRAESPVYPAPVTRVVLQTVSSSNALRRLTFTPYRAGVALTNHVRYCAYSPTKNIFVSQTLSWPYAAKVDSFRISLEQGGSTAWGISHLTVYGDDPPRTGFYLRFR